MSTGIIFIFGHDQQENNQVEMLISIYMVYFLSMKLFVSKVNASSDWPHFSQSDSIKGTRGGEEKK